LGRLSVRPDVLALAFHVTYWDDLGWRDRFGLAQAVTRQNGYARRLHRKSVYTPQFVIDGQADNVGSAARLITEGLSATRDGVGVDIVVRDGAVVVDVGGQPAATASDVLLVAYLRHAVSIIGRGENAGRALNESNVVREVRTLGTWTGVATGFRVPVSALPADATDVAILVQLAGQGPFVGAKTTPLR
jgi:hypothetical protein